MTTEGMIAPPAARELVWVDDEHRLEVWFDSDCTVVAFRQRAGYSRLHPSLWERLLQLVGL